MGDNKDPFRDITFDGQPGGYREFRRKVILSAAAVEYKNQHLVGPKLLSRLTGEAWRCTEHLPISEVRLKKGWIKVLECLDQHYRYLPEVELHEAIDEFMFKLSRRPNEGATAFSSRFRTQLSRLETLIAQERDIAKEKRDGRKRKHDLPGPASHVPSSLAESSESETGGGDEPADETDDAEPATQPEQAAEASASDAQPSQPPAQPKTASRPPSRTSHPPSQQGSYKSVHSGSSGRKSKRQLSSGTWQADMEKQQLEMQQILGSVERSHRKPKPIFPQSVLGHLYMRKYGLSKEQRSQVIRATGGSSRFLDVERILRASDIEDNHRRDPKRHQVPFKSQRRDAYAVQVNDDDASSSIEAPMSSTESGEEAMLGETGEKSGDGSDEELQEVYEMQKKAKRDFKKSFFRTYKESKKRVKEIKKSRSGTPYFPVVAMTPEQAAASSGAAPSQKSFKYDQKQMVKRKGDGKSQKQQNPRKEDANMAVTEVLTEFSYMVEDQFVLGDDVQEILLASIPTGYAILDTGCTTSVVGEDTATAYRDLFQQSGYPPPQGVELPPVELKGFNGRKETTNKGLKWTVRLGNLHGCITTYLVPGQTPFLLSRRVLEGMGASLDLGRMTITSEKHGMQSQPLQQAANGHLILPLYPVEDIKIAEAPACSSQDCQHEPDTNNPKDNPQPRDNLVQDRSDSTEDNPEKSCTKPHKPAVTFKPSSPSQSLKDRKKAFQHVVKNTKKGVVDVDWLKEQLVTIYGNKGEGIVHAAVAYKPKKERIPQDAGQVPYMVSVATLSADGQLHVSPWQCRPQDPDRKPVNAMPVAIFAYAHAESSEETAAVGHEHTEACCTCCNDAEPHHDVPASQLDVEQLYDEDNNWVDVGHQEPVPMHSQEKLRDGIRSLRKLSSRLVVSRISEDPSAVRAELQHWLGSQADKLDKPVGLVEVFTGKAPLSAKYEAVTGLGAIRIGLDYGQDLTKLQDRRNLLLLIAYCRPQHVWFSFPCRHWGPWSRFNMARSETARQEIMAQRAIARRYLKNVSEAWHLQVGLGGQAHAENPLSSDAWDELHLGKCWSQRIDQCALGLRCPKTKLPVLKATGIVTSQESLAKRLVSCRCDGKHNHQHLEGNYRGQPLTRWAETYPNKFCRVMVECFQLQEPANNRNMPIEEVFAAEDQPDQLAQIPEYDPDVSVPVEPQAAEQSPARIAAMIQKLHVNTGHSSKEQMMRLAVRCQSSAEIRKCISNFRCGVCEELKQPPSHRKATVLHNESPNHVVGLDFVQVELKREDANGKVREITKNVLTCVDLATDFAQQIIVEPGPHGCLAHFTMLGHVHTVSQR